MYSPEILQLYRFICKNIAKPQQNKMFRAFIEKTKGKELTIQQSINIRDYIVLFSTTSENTVSPTLLTFFHF